MRLCHHLSLPPTLKRKKQYHPLPPSPKVQNKTQEPLRSKIKHHLGIYMSSSVMQRKFVLKIGMSRFFFEQCPMHAT